MKDRMLLNSVLSGFHKQHILHDPYQPNEQFKHISYSPIVGLQYVSDLSLFALSRDYGGFEFRKQTDNDRNSIVEVHSMLQIKSGK